MTRRREKPSFTIRPDLTAVYRHPALPGGVHLRFSARSDGRLVVAELSASAPAEQGGVTSWGLDQIRIARLQAIANSPVTKAVLRRGIVFTTHFTTQSKTARSRLKLPIPKGRKYDDAFYRRVADAFSALAETSRRPAQDLADANNVPVSTVNRWIREAREREMLPPGQRRKGKAT